MTILDSFKASLPKYIQDKILKFILIGSRLTNEKKDNSDYDIIVVVKNTTDSYEFIKEISPFISNFSFRNELVLGIYPIKDDVLKYQHSQFIHNIIYKGIEF